MEAAISGMSSKLSQHCLAKSTLGASEIAGYERVRMAINQQAPTSEASAFHSVVKESKQ